MKKKNVVKLYRVDFDAEERHRRDVNVQCVEGSE
jgi:hypothetical protein